MLIVEVFADRWNLLRFLGSNLLHNPLADLFGWNVFTSVDPVDRSRPAMALDDLFCFPGRLIYQECALNLILPLFVARRRHLS